MNIKHYCLNCLKEVNKNDINCNYCNSSLETNITRVNLDTLYLIDDIKLANKNFNGHFFDKNTLKFFKSRIGSTVYFNKYFITSEQYDNNSKRLFTIREFCLITRRVSTAKGTSFQQFKTANQAKAYILKNFN